MRALIVGCILKRELIGLLRTRRAFWLLFASVAGAGGITLLSWPVETGTATLGETALRLVNTFFLAEGVIVVLVTISLARGSILEEKRQETLEQLLVTPIHPAAIVFSKFVASSGFVLAVLAAGAPCAAALYLQGGIEISHVWGAMLAIAAFGSVAGLVTLWKSLRVRPASQAENVSKAGASRWAGGSNILAGVIWLVVFGFQATIRQVFPTGLFSWTVALALFGSVVLAVLLLVLWGLSIQRVEVGAVSGPQFATRRPGPTTRRHHWAKWFLARDRKSLGSPLNPIFLRELRIGVVGQEAFVQYLLIPSMVLPPLLIPFVGAGTFMGGGREIANVLGLLTVGVAGLALPALAVSSAVRDRESGALDQLRSTFLRPLEIVLGSWSATLFVGLPFLVFAVMFLWVSLSLTRYGGAVLILVSTIASSGAFAVLVGVAARTLTGALFTTYGGLGILNLFAFTVPPALGAVWEGRAWSFMAAWNPLVAMHQLHREPIAASGVLFAVTHLALTALFLLSATELWSRRVARER